MHHHFHQSTLAINSTLSLHKVFLVHDCGKKADCVRGMSHAHAHVHARV